MFVRERGNQSIIIKLCVCQLMNTIRGERDVGVRVHVTVYVIQSQCKELVSYGCTLYMAVQYRVYLYITIAGFWRTFHHDGKISPGW